MSIQKEVDRGSYVAFLQNPKTDTQTRFGYVSRITCKNGAELKIDVIEETSKQIFEDVEDVFPIPRLDLSPKETVTYLGREGDQSTKCWVKSWEIRPDEKDEGSFALFTTVVNYQTGEESTLPAKESRDYLGFLSECLILCAWGEKPPEYIEQEIADGDINLHYSLVKTIRDGKK